MTLRATGGARLTPRHVHSMSFRATRILARAQQTAERYVADAQAYSREIAQDAHRRREEILAEASARAASLLEEAHGTAVRPAVTVVRPAVPAAELSGSRQAGRRFRS